MQRPASGDFLQWLKTFIYVSEIGSIHKAAATLCVTPSAVWHHIRKLEQDLGIVLFVRKNKGMVLTQEGRQFRANSIPVLEAVENLRVGKGHEQAALQGPISVACLNRLAHHVVPDIVEFRKLHPDVHFNMDPTSSPRVYQRLEQGNVDLAFHIYSKLPGDLHFTNLRPSSGYLYTPPGNPFGLSPKPTWNELCTLPFIALTLEGYVNPVVANVPELPRPKNIVVAINDFILAMQLVKAGYGVCIAPPLTPLECADDYTIFNIDHIVPGGDFGILTRRDSYLSIQAKAFIAYVAERYALRLKGELPMP